MWPTRAGDWPSYMQRPRWVPARDAASVVCLRLDIPCEVVTFDNIEQAAEAVEELYRDGCGPQCSGHHVIVWTRAGEASHVLTGPHDPPAVPADLSAALVAAGYKPLRHDSLMSTPRLWPAPSVLNPPMTGAPPMNPETRRLQDQAIEAASNRVIEPHPGGMAGRAVAEHDAGIEALAAGDIDAAIGCDIAAEALTAAVLADRPAEELRTHCALIARPVAAQAPGRRV
jgi:hypothetical protein